jgi:hypothetical protein
MPLQFLLRMIFHFRRQITPVYLIRHCLRFIDAASFACFIAELPPSLQPLPR